jgi:type IV pilus assembly protein PilC
MTATMPTFRYTAETLEGEEVKGRIEAPSVVVARNQLAVQGMRVTRTRVPLVEIMHFSRQMATFLRAGVPITEALDNLRTDTKNKRFAAVLSDIIERVGAGRSLAEAAGHHADVFPTYFLALLESADYTGRLDEAFEQLHVYVKRDLSLTRQIRKALIYPMILLVLAIAVSILIVVFVIPKFADFYRGFQGADGKPAQLPTPTRMLIAVADFVQSTAGLITAAALAAVLIGMVLWTRTGTGRRSLHGVLLRLPLVGKVLTYSATERFTRVLGVLLNAGVTLPEALPTAIECSNNLVFQTRLHDASADVLSGSGFAEPIRSTGLFPSAVVQMIRVGERTGELADQLGNAAGFYEDELSYSIEKLTQWFEPAVLVFIGLVVGFVALAMVSAMYGIYNQLPS